MDLKWDKGRIICVIPILVPEKGLQQSTKQSNQTIFCPLLPIFLDLLNLLDPTF